MKLKTAKKINDSDVVKRAAKQSERQDFAADIVCAYYQFISTFGAPRTASFLLLLTLFLSGAEIIGVANEITLYVHTLYPDPPMLIKLATTALIFPIGLMALPQALLGFPAFLTLFFAKRIEAALEKKVATTTHPSTLSLISEEVL
jgi:hypothetical protein